MKENKGSEVKLRFFGIGKALPYLKPYGILVFTMLFCSCVGSVMDIIMPLLQRYALNHFVGEGTLDTLAWFIAVYILFLIITAVVNYVAMFLATKIEVSVNRELRNKSFKHLQTLSFSYFNQNSVGYIHSRIMNDTSQIGMLVSHRLMDSLWHLIYLIGSIAVMFCMNPRLTLAVLVLLPLTVIFFTFFRKKLVKINREIRELNSQLSSDFNETIVGANTIKSLAIEDKMNRDFTANTEVIRKTVVHSSRLHGLFSITMNLASSAALAIVLWRGGYIAKSEVGTFSMFVSYAQGMIEPVRWLVGTFTSLVTTQVNIERFLNLLSTKSDVTDTDAVVEKYGDCFNPRRENWEPLNGDIEFRNVSFKYPDGDEYVLENFSLKIPQGSSIAIVGETGAGKSTLVNLICRFFEVTEGEVLIDGKNVKERSQLWLHSSIGYVLQTPHLFSGSIRDNLKYAKEDATDEEMLAALKAAAADKIVARLEKGLDSDVGEGGDMLSTGEKQLISFARAILADPRILVLDEATASVDTITEQIIQETTERVIRGRTSIVIAHRLSTIKNSDHIIVIKNGKICEQGTHKELITKRGYYCDLYTRQYEDEATATVLNRA